jgi:hypothetical protein
LELGDHQWSKIKNKSTPFITIYSNVWLIMEMCHVLVNWSWMC